MFDRKGQVYLDASKSKEDEALEAALEAGAEDFARDGDQYVVTTTPDRLPRGPGRPQPGGLHLESAELAMVPRNTVKVEGPDAEQLIKLMETLEELDDVSKVFSNFDIDATHWPRPSLTPPP